MMKKVAFRVDGGVNIGMGHIMRTLVLAKELAKTNEVFYICKFSESNPNRYMAGINKIKEEGFNVITINEDSFINALDNIKADILFTDSYNVSKEYFKKIKKIFKNTIYLDDLNCIDYYEVDLLINANLGAENFHYKTNNKTILLKGTQYSILREEFRNSEPNNIKNEVKDILVTMGGADPPSFTDNILSYVKDLPFRFHIVVGNSFKNIEHLKSQENLYGNNVKLYFNANIYELMKRMDLAITAGGTTIYELSALGIPHLLVVLADNQERAAKVLDDKGISVNLGWYTKINKEYLIGKLLDLANDYTLRQEIQKTQLKCINKFGVNKIIEQINLLNN